MIIYSLNSEYLIISLVLNFLNLKLYDKHANYLHPNKSILQFANYVILNGIYVIRKHIAQLYKT